MNKGEVILYNTTDKSLSWNNGLFVVIENRGRELHAVKLDKQGEVHRHENGAVMKTVFNNVKNPALSKTSLKYKGEL